ncbi:MAG: endonuclease/exonuclease/phosphatase family protein [Bacteroidales bacterium]|nr:endonuclease/exonuclease/phosphatase family protein [Bacteroidales bacterium]
MSNFSVRFLPLILLLLASGVSGYGQKEKQQLKVVFYNVENLFDTIDDKHKNDNEFLPGSEKDWNGERYFRKLSNLAKVLVAIDSLNLPAIVGFAEVENRQVLEDLVRTTPLQKAPYQVILEEGPDPRGIDVALIFRSDKLTYLSHQAVAASAKFQTRDILYVKLLGPAKDTLHLFVNHWKSRSGGEEKTRPKRIENATLLRHVVDSLFAMNTSARILIMGDLNDEPSDESVALALEALPVDKKPESRELYNLFYNAYTEGEGTLWYRDWDLFDQIIVSGNLLGKKKKNSPAINPPSGSIFSESWMLDPEGAKEPTPFRSYAYKRGYIGGFSDHLPVYIVLTY